MTIVESIDVVMGARTAELDAAVSKEIANLKKLEQGAKLAGGFNIGFTASALAAGGLAFEISQIVGQLKAIDDTADAAKKLGSSFADLKVLQLGLGESSGLAAEDINKAVQRMQIALVDASRDPNSDIAKQLGSVGLSPSKLLAGGTLDAFKELSGVISGIGSQADQLAFASDIFGKNGAALVQSLREGPDQINDMADFAQKFGLNLSDAQAEMVGMANDSVARLSLAFEGINTQLTAELSPAITAISQDILSILGRTDNWNDSLSFAADYVAYTYGTIKDLLELQAAPGSIIGALIGGGLDKATEKLSSAITFDQGEAAVKNVFKARDAAKEAAESTKQKRLEQITQNSLLEKELESQKKLREEQEKQLKAKQDLVDSVSDELAKLQASNQAALNGEKFDSKAFDEKQKLEKLGSDGFELQLQRLQRERQEQEAISDAIKEAADLKEKFKEGDQRLVDELRKLETLKQAGLIDQAIFDKAAKEAEQSTQKGDVRQGAVSVQQGSVAAYKLLLERDNELTKTAKSQERIATATLTVLEEARDGILKIKSAKRQR